MPRLPNLLLALFLFTALGACDRQPTREEKILADLPLQEAYEHNIDKIAALLAPKHPSLSQEQIQAVVRKHLTVEDQRQDLFKLYSEAHFSDAEFDLIVTATQDPAKAKTLGETEQGKRLSEKLTTLMRESANDRNAQALAEQRMRQVEHELTELEQAKP